MTQSLITCETPFFVILFSSFCFSQKPKTKALESIKEVILQNTHHPRTSSMASSISASTNATTTSSIAHHHHLPPNFYFDEKWKLSKKEGSSLSSSRSSRSASSNCGRKSSSRRCSFSRKCARLVKQQRARFYIVRRCITMLICWHDYSDSWKRGGSRNREKAIAFFLLSRRILALVLLDLFGFWFLGFAQKTQLSSLC